MRVIPASRSQMYISWSLEGDTFTVSRSTSPTGEFEVIAEGVEQPFVIDPKVDQYDYNVRYYYKVEGYVNGAVVATDGPGTIQYNQPDGLADKVIYEYAIALKMMNNPPVFFLLKKRTGGYCPDCWNTITNTVKYANCPTCHGTGRLSGYHPPIKTRISQNISQLIMTSGEEDSDKTSLTPVEAWIGNMPLLTPEDIMVDIMDQRYKIVSVAPRTKSQYVLRQIIQLAPLEKGHPAYNVEVDREASYPWQ